MVKLNDFKIEFCQLGKVLPSELIKLNPDIQWTPEEMCTEAASESWNKDEFSEEGYFALKSLFFRLLVPKEHWNDIDYDKFFRIVLDRYKSKLGEDL